MNDEKIILSIIIPVYNVAKYLKRCLESVIGQDTNEVEIILVNDGSTDNSEEICSEYVSGYDNIKLINQKNSGLSAARNTGINNSKGEYLLFLDSDDWLTENCISIIKEVIKKNNSKDVLFGKTCCYDENTGNITKVDIDFNKFNIKKCPAQIFNGLIKQNHFWFAAWLCIVRREFIIENELYFMPGILHEDELWVPLIMIKAKSILLLDLFFYCYRINRSGSIISNKNIKKELDKLTIIDNLNSRKGLVGKYGKKIIKERTAALEWGVINNYRYFSDNVQQCELYNGINKNIKCLKYKKYFLIYFYIKIFSLKKLLLKRDKS